jgi:hypothetical protein
VLLPTTTTVVVEVELLQLLAPASTVVAMILTYLFLISALLSYIKAVTSKYKLPCVVCSAGSRMGKLNFKLCKLDLKRFHSLRLWVMG